VPASAPAYWLPRLRGALLENGMGLIPELAVDNGLVLAGIADAPLCTAFADVDPGCSGSL